MSPTIFSDIGNRGITDPEDILPIAANCYGYTSRLDTKMLRKKRCSLSICILALYLLNGEILGNEDDKISLSENIFRFLERGAFHSFNPPVEAKRLTFMKSCRFVNVKLSEDGIQTSGWLWKLHKTIPTSQLNRWQ
jgi:hypothetical protein